MTDRRTEAGRVIGWQRFPETEWRDEVRQLGAGPVSSGVETQLRFLSENPRILKAKETSREDKNDRSTTTSLC
jgi:hypothetical protein